MASLGYPTVFYRLQEVDLDGKSTYSQIVSVNLAHPFKVSLSPNPVQQQEINLTIEDNTAETATIDIIDVSGRSIQKGEASLQQGTNLIRLDGRSLSAGVYFLTVRTGNHPVTLQFMKE